VAKSAGAVLGVRIWVPPLQIAGGSVPSPGGPPTNLATSGLGPVHPQNRGQSWYRPPNRRWPNPPAPESGCRHFKSPGGSVPSPGGHPTDLATSAGRGNACGGVSAASYLSRHVSSPLESSARPPALLPPHAPNTLRAKSRKCLHSRQEGSHA
jgi:hypothetical protein